MVVRQDVAQHFASEDISIYTLSHMVQVHKQNTPRKIHPALKSRLEMLNSTQQTLHFHYSVINSSKSHWEKALLCVFLPPSSRKIQLHIHARLNQAPRLFTIFLQGCRKDATVLQYSSRRRRRSRTERSSRWRRGKKRGESEEQGKTWLAFYSPPIRR